MNNSIKKIKHYCLECGNPQKSGNDHIVVSTPCLKHQIAENEYKWVGEVRVHKKFSSILEKATESPVLSKPQLVVQEVVV